MYICVRTCSRHGVWVICHQLCVVAVSISTVLHFICKNICMYVWMHMLLITVLHTPLSIYIYYSNAFMCICVRACVSFYNYFCIILFIATVCRLSFWCSYALYVLRELRRVASHLYRIVSYRMTYLRQEMPYIHC